MGGALSVGLGRQAGIEAQGSASPDGRPRSPTLPGNKPRSSGEVFLPYPTRACPGVSPVGGPPSKLFCALFKLVFDDVLDISLYMCFFFDLGQHQN